MIQILKHIERPLRGQGTGFCSLNRDEQTWANVGLVIMYDLLTKQILSEYLPVSVLVFYVHYLMEYSQQLR